jgi:hypothetical protein
MRHAGNFNPEWGYIAPAPNFIRTARLFVVAAAIGATASAAVVFSLMNRPAAEASVAARTLVQRWDILTAICFCKPWPAGCRVPLETPMSLHGSGGDEFVILQAAITSADQAETLASRVRRRRAGHQARSSWSLDARAA